MPLADDQKLLTRLLTDRSLLDRFLQDPVEAAENAGFLRESALRLAQIPPEHLRGSGRSLIQKRASAVAKFLSQTHKALGREAFHRIFRGYAETYWPKGSKRHRDDAIGFGTYLQGQAIALVDPGLGLLGNDSSCVSCLFTDDRRAEAPIPSVFLARGGHQSRYAARAFDASHRSSASGREACSVVGVPLGFRTKGPYSARPGLTLLENPRLRFGLVFAFCPLIEILARSASFEVTLIANSPHFRLERPKQSAQGIALD